jgi:peptide/nickel transport system permease protein
MLGTSKSPINVVTVNMLGRILSGTINSLRGVIDGIITTFRLRELGFQGKIGVFVLVFFVLVSIFGPVFAPYNPKESLVGSDGKLKSLEPPSLQHPLGTTWQGRDVLSQVLYGARPTLVVGAIAAFIITFIGVNTGIIAGYFGGKTDMLLMRFVDILYGLPFLPFTVVLVCLLGRSEMNVIIAIVVITWRAVTRVVRAQVLTLRELPYVKAAKVMGAGDFRILYVHIFPNILPIAVLYLAFGVVWAILAHADLCFLGFGDPEVITWGKMIHSAWAAGVITQASQKKE